MNRLSELALQTVLKCYNFNEYSLIDSILGYNIGNRSDDFLRLPATIQRKLVLEYHPTIMKHIFNEIENSQDGLRDSLHPFIDTTPFFCLENYSFGRFIRPIHLFKYFLWLNRYNHIYIADKLCLEFFLYQTIDGSLKICSTCRNKYVAYCTKLKLSCNNFMYFNLKSEMEISHVVTTRSSLSEYVRDDQNWCRFCVFGSLFTLTRCALDSHRFPRYASRPTIYSEEMSSSDSDDMF